MRIETKGEILEVTMFHVVNIGKHNALANFKKYLDTLMKEFEHEVARTVYPQLPPTTSHIIVP